MISTLQVVEAKTPADMKAFIELPYDLYRGDPTWCPPLRMMQKELFDPKKNFGLNHIDVAYWLAKIGGRVVGRIASFVNHTHLKVHDDETGHFGFLDTDPGYPQVQKALLDRAEEWLRAKGMKEIGGPYNFSVNEECGMLIDGFDTPEMMLMPHGACWHHICMERAGYEKAMDTYAFLTHTRDGYPRPSIIPKMQEYLDRTPSLVIRPMDKSRFTEEITLAMDIFNDSWANNWNFVPYSDEQVQHMAGEIKLLMDPAGVWFGEVDGVAKGFIMMLPNLNEATRGLDGRLFPFGWMKLLWRLKVKGVSSARVPLMGIRQEVQKTRTGTALMLNLFETCFSAMRPRGYHSVEMSWILETNKDVQNMIHLCGADIYKTYRLYRKTL